MPDSEDDAPLEALARQVAGMATSLRVLSVCFVMLALPYAATGYGLIVAWAPVWLGVLLWQAANAARGEPPELPRLMRKLRQFVFGFSLFAIGMLVLAAALALLPYTVVIDALRAAGL